MSTTSWNSVYQMWRQGYVNRRNHYINKPVFECYNYEVSFNIDKFSTPEQLQEIEKYCEENFGELNECDPECRWQVCSEEVTTGHHSHTVRVEQFVTFLFHNQEDAVAFKLKWL